MLRRIRDQVGTAGLVVAVVALVVALAGGALAASGGGGATASKGKSKAARGPRGAKGAKGDVGPTGPQGPAGANGKDGAAGAKGQDGASVTVSEADEFECEFGGAIVQEKGAGAGIEVCSGEPGEDGQPWTPDNTLPPGATETGGWAFNGVEANPEIYTALSFPIQLAQALEEEHVHYVTAGEQTAHSNAACPGEVEAPSAKPGELCVYEGFVINNVNSPMILRLGAGAPGASVSGAFLDFTEASGVAEGIGSWAVTGCSTTVGDPNECPA